MTEHNSRIVEALNRYITMKHAPHYAIMLNGEWGSGKTFFIKEKWLKYLANKEKYSIVYVSLFGLKTVDELKDLISHDKVLLEEFINKSQPTRKLLSKSKKIKNTNASSGILNLGKQLFEKHIGININDIIKIFTRDWLGEDDKNGVTKILILDDLERVQMNINEVFGFISNHLESTSLRVIIIGNENEISKDNDYSETKEKVIGDTYRIDLDIYDALNAFIEDIQYSNDHNILLNEVFKSIMTQLNFSNLRIVRQSLIKLKPLLEIIESNSAYKNYEHDTIMILRTEGPKSNYLKEVISFFILVNFQKSLGILDKEDISNIKIAFNSGLTVETYLERKAKEKAEREKNKQNSYDFSELYIKTQTFTPLTDSIKYNLWCKYIWDGELDKNLLDNAIVEDMCTLVPDKRQQVDTLLKFYMGYWDYSIDEFNNLLEILIKELESGYYTDANAIVAAYALFIHLSTAGTHLPATLITLDTFFEKVLDETKLTLPEDARDYRLWDWDTSHISYKGYAIFESYNNQQIKDFIKKVRKLYKEHQSIFLKQELDSFVNSIIENKENINKLCMQVFWESSEISKHFSMIPALEWIGSDRLWIILTLSLLADQRTLFSSLSKRYGIDSCGCEDSYLVYKPELPVVHSLYIKYEKQYEVAQNVGDNKIMIYNHLYNDAKRIYDGLKEKLEIGETILAKKMQG